jgi:UDP-N-acetylmuramyl pentapeptide phosphotransferase/UDP-N-acetylglucosamine-1-phosphate transferase
MDDLKKTSQRKASFGATIKAVLWSFFGVRKRSDYEKDAQQLNPVHVIIAGIVAAAIFVAILLLIVNAVVAN